MSDLSEWDRASREAQGLPPTVTDPQVLARIAAIIAAVPADPKTN